MAETTMTEMVCGRNVLWPNQSVDEMSRKHLGTLKINTHPIIIFQYFSSLPVLHYLQAVPFFSKKYKDMIALKRLEWQSENLARNAILELLIKTCTNVLTYNNYFHVIFIYRVPLKLNWLNSEPMLVCMKFYYTFMIF
jgi:hypothetical protein